MTLLVALAAIGLYIWWYSAVEAASGKASSLLVEITTQGQTKNRIAQARKALADLETEEQAVNSYFVAQSDIVPFLEQLQTLGTKLGTTVNVTSVAANPDPKSPTLTVLLSVQGSFDHVMRTIGAIENSPYDISVSSLALSGTSKDGWNAAMTFVVGSGAPPATTTPATTP